MSGTVWPQVVLSTANGVPYDSGNPLPITGTITASFGALANAAAPTYIEGSTTNLLSVNLSGDLRTIAKQSGTWTVTGTGGTFPVTGTFWQATQPVSAASLPLPTGAALDTSLATLHTDFSVAQPRAVNASAATGGIASTARLASAAASTNATNVKASAGRIYSVCGRNNAAYDVFLVIYDAATNPPVPGTTTIRKKIVCPAGQAFVYDYPLGLSCASGIGYAFTKLVADADTTVLVAADVTAFNLDYV